MTSDQRPDSFEVADYTRVLRRRWPIVVVVTCLGLIGALGYAVTAPKTYAATAQVFVSPTGADMANQLANSRTQGTVNLDTEAQIVQSGSVAAIAGKTLHSSLTPYELSKNISVSVPPNSQVLNIACKASTGTAAAACANAFAAAYLQNRSATAASAVAQQLTPLQAKVAQLQKAVSQLNSTIGGLPSNSSQRLTAQAQVQSDNSQLANLNSAIAALDKQAANTNGGHVTTPAGVPGAPSSPKKALVLPSGLAAGLVVGLIGAFVWDRRDKRIREPRDLERFFRLPVLLSLPRKALGRQVSLASPRSRTGRAFTEMAHAVAASLGEGSHVVLVAGTVPGPGASFVAANLAATLARTHSEAVLVCAALRDSVAPQLFGLADGSRGLAEAVAGRATVADVARGPSAVPGLWVIPPGAELSLAEYNLQYDTAKALTAQLRRDARFVVIEAQATEQGIDSLALAEFADAAVLTVEAYRTKRDEAEACIERLNRMRTPLIGAAIIPAVPPGVEPRPPQRDHARRGPGEDERRPASLEPGSDGASAGPVSAMTGVPIRQQRPAGRSADRYGDAADPAHGS